MCEIQAEGPRSEGLQTLECCGTIGEDIPEPGVDVLANTPGGDAGLGNSAGVGSPRINSERPTSSSGIAIDEDADPKADGTSVDILCHSQKVHVDSLSATTYHALRDVNVSFNHISHHYHPPPRPVTTFDIPTNKISPSQLEFFVASIGREITSLYREFGSALAELSANANDNSTIGQRFQDLYDRMEALQSFASAHMLHNPSSTSVTPS
ncbi:hypothetical protein FA13DRAFT_1803249 [Coprinellus micaceus]|uniref:Uncharacterized protein n=1 Tax=Coprinellus micaceus TaxID=71717 RepID=A0A4Y7SBQ9_COPMI|nr:hypothetical protein FA13DRAFT_1803249 [Coprinellus micaceus]